MFAWAATGVMNAFFSIHHAQFVERSLFIDGAKMIFHFIKLALPTYSKISPSTN